MIGSDTNVLARAVLEDHPSQSKFAKRLLKKLTKEKKLFISSYAILEMVWVLKMKKCTRKQICGAIIFLLDSPGVFIGQREVIISALEKYMNGKADFGDYMILSEGEQNSAPRLASFDKELCKDSSQVRHPDEYI